METPSSSESAPVSRARVFLVLGACFFLSGATGLVYQVVGSACWAPPRGSSPSWPGVTEWTHFLGYYILGPGDIARLAGEGPLNTDDRLSLEFTAPRAL